MTFRPPVDYRDFGLTALGRLKGDVRNMTDVVNGVAPPPRPVRKSMAPRPTEDEHLGMGDLDRLWPLLRLRLRCGPVELHLPNDAELASLAELAKQPIHDPATMPFSVPWTDAPPDRRAVSVVQYHWRVRGVWTPEDWTLELVACRNGEVVGSQGISGTNFAAAREVSTGSWVGGRYQGQGIATTMRTAVLHLAFAGLGARRARSGAFDDNRASLRVSEKLGYLPDGTETIFRRGQPATIIRLLITQEEWNRRVDRRPPVIIEELSACRALFGLGDSEVAQLPPSPTPI